MRLVNLYRIIATVCVLVAEKGVRGHHHDNDDKDNTPPVAAVIVEEALPTTSTAVRAEATTAEVLPTTSEATTAEALPSTSETTTAEALTTTSEATTSTPVVLPNTSPSLPPPPPPPTSIPTPALPSTPPPQAVPAESNNGMTTMQAAGPPTVAENPATGVEMTPAKGQDESGPGSGNNSSAQAGAPPAAAQMEAPNANQAPNMAPIVAAVQGPPGGEIKKDPATGDLLGGNPPSKNVDLPITIVFLGFFLTGAITHISIYRANAKRGHKFLLSDLMFDFCMIRSVTCIFRIIWVFSQLRGIVLAAQIFFNGGAAVIFVVNIFFAQRIVRSMHPVVGWSKPFSLGTNFLALSVPPVIILQIVSISIFFLSTDNPDRGDVAVTLLKTGSSWNIWLVSFPFLTIFISCAIPGPKPDKFGSGSLRVKTSLAMLGAALLATGATVRTYGTFNPRPRDSGDVLYSKTIFYVTQFSFEIIVVALYAFLRIDLLFHVPNGSSQPGDYSANKPGDTEKALTREEIRDKIEAIGLSHQILKPAYTSPFTQKGQGTEPVIAVFYPSAPDAASFSEVAEDYASEGKLPPRPADRVSRRQSLVSAFQSSSSMSRRPIPSSYGQPRQSQQPSRPPRSTYSMYRTSPDELDYYQEKR